MKKQLAAFLSAAIVASLVAVPSFAAAASFTDAYDTDGEVSDSVPNGVSGWSGLETMNIGDSASIDMDPVRPGSTFYVALAAGSNSTLADGNIEVSDIVDSDYFKFSVDKDTNSKMVSSITLVTEKALNGMDRTSYLKFVLNDT